MSRKLPGNDLCHFLCGYARGSNLTVSSFSYGGSLAGLLAEISGPRRPASMARWSHIRSSASVQVKEITATLHAVRSRCDQILSIMRCSCMTQQKTTCSMAEHFRKLLSRTQIFSMTMAFVSSVTWNGCISQHQSPSSRALLGSSIFNSRHTVLFPTPMVPPIKYSVFIFSFQISSASMTRYPVSISAFANTPVPGISLPEKPPS